AMPQITSTLPGPTRHSCPLKFPCQRARPRSFWRWGAIVQTRGLRQLQNFAVVQPPSQPSLGLLDQVAGAELGGRRRRAGRRRLGARPGTDRLALRLALLQPRARPLQDRLQDVAPVLPRPGQRPRRQLLARGRGVPAGAQDLLQRRVVHLVLVGDSGGRLDEVARNVLFVVVRELRRGQQALHEGAQVTPDLLRGLVQESLVLLPFLIAPPGSELLELAGLAVRLLQPLPDLRGQVRLLHRRALPST